jgi:hypothetical protein
MPRSGGAEEGTPSRVGCLLQRISAGQGTSATLAERRASRRAGSWGSRRPAGRSKDGSGTVAPTKCVPIQRRVSAAVIVRTLRPTTSPDRLAVLRVTVNGVKFDGSIPLVARQVGSMRCINRARCAGVPGNLATTLGGVQQPRRTHGRIRPEGRTDSDTHPMSLLLDATLFPRWSRTGSY